MEHMSRKYKKEDAMLRPHKESTLEKQEKARNKPKPQELAVGGKGDILNRKNNERMNRKKALLAAMNKLHDADIA
jgi:hypothetical protein